MAEPWAGRREPMPNPVLRLRRAVERAMMMASPSSSCPSEADSRVRSESASSRGWASAGMGRDDRKAWATRRLRGCIQKCLPSLSR